MTAYGYLWLGQNLPQFTTKEAAFVPFDIEESTSLQLVNRTFTATTRMYYTTLHCEPAVVNRTEERVHYSDRNGCVTDQGPQPCTNCSAAGLYIGWYSGLYNDWSLLGMGCRSPKSSHSFLAIWGNDWSTQLRDGMWTTEPKNRTVLFCKPKYWLQDAELEIDANNKTVIAASPIGKPEPLGKDLFNISNFEYVLGGGSSVISPRADPPDTSQVIDQWTQLTKIGWNTTAITTNMIGYALGSTRLPMQEYVDPKKLTSSFEKAHQLLFALCVHSLLKPADTVKSLGKCTVRGNCTSLILLRPLAIATEVFLLIVSLSVFVLWRISCVRQSGLLCDPASLKSIMCMTSGVVQYAESNDSDSQENQKTVWSLREGQLRARKQTQAMSSPISRKCSQGTTSTILSQEHDMPKSRETRKYSRPIEMGYVVGAGFLVTLALALGILVIVHYNVQRHGGLSAPSASSSLNQLVLNYIPVAFANLLEPFWTLLNRLLCVLRPLQMLATGDAPASRSLELRYTSLPPQLIFLRALKARHYLLAAICATAFSANLLAISLNGLFEIRSSIHESHIKLGSPSNGTIVQATLRRTSDHVYLAQANFSGQTSSGPWVSGDAYFLPFTMPENAVALQIEAFKGRTMGFGASLACDEVGLDTDAFIGGDASHFVLPRQSRGGRRFDCDIFTEAIDKRPNGGQDNSKSATEVWLPAKAMGNNSEEAEICSRTIVAGFVRATLSLPRSGFKTDNSNLGSKFIDITHIDSSDALWLACDSRIVSGAYDVTVDPRGQVLSYESISAKSAIGVDQFRNGTNATMLHKVANDLLYPRSIDYSPW